MNQLNFSGDLCNHSFKKAKYRQDTTSDTGLWDSYYCLLQPILQRKSRDLKWGGLEKLREYLSHATLAEWMFSGGVIPMALSLGHFYCRGV